MSLVQSDEVMTMLGELHGGQGDQQGHPNREGGSKLIRFESPRWRPKSSLSPPRNSGPVCLELVTQDAYELRFQWSIYGWKAYLIRKPTQVVLRKNIFGINGNRQNKSPFRICQGAVSPSFGPIDHVSCWALSPSYGRPTPSRSQS
jgi:hypothetical protein